MLRKGWMLGAVVLGSVVGAGCVDLFHSTDFGSCTGDACADAASDAGHPRADATLDAAKDAKDSGGDAARADATRVRDAGHEASSDAVVPDAPHDARPGPTDFCTWSLAEAQEHAAYACDWLGACEGATAALGIYDVCYPYAFLAYDCAAYPEHRVTGLVHAFWDAMWQVKSCEDVNKAVFPLGPSTCSKAGNGCVQAGDAGEDTTLICAEEGGIPTGSNCAALGATCISGQCQVSGDPGCPSSTDAMPPASEAGCDGTVFHACQLTWDPRQVQVGDISQDCRYFGAGTCRMLDGGGGGCVPGDAGALAAQGAGTPCTPSPLATCNGSRYAVGCPTGILQVVDCETYGSSCSLSNGRFASANQPETACFDPRDAGDAAMVSGCDAGTLIVYPGFGGAVVSSCIDAGLGPCVVPDGGRGPACTPPP